MNVHAQVPDPSECEREPIHIPGSIQPHGALLALTVPDLMIAHASGNAGRLLGVVSRSLVGQSLETVSPRLYADLARDLRACTQGGAATYLKALALPTSTGRAVFDAVVHGASGLVILELEEISSEPNGTLDQLYPSMRLFVETLQNATTIADLCQLAAENIRRLTGFDRVLVYRFDPQWHGTVLAEDRNDVLPSYLDLRFPASDIPAQARELYRRNRVRIIPDATYSPVAVEPILNEATGQSLDMSQSVLRSVSPVHLEYMRNMGTLASMSISIMRDGELWGLISCHNKEPKRVSLQARNACDFVTQIFSLQLAARESAARAEYRLRLGSVGSRLLAYMAQEERYLDGLTKHPDDVVSLANAEGAAVVSEENCWLLGSTPSSSDVQGLFDWLSLHHREDMFATDNLAAVYPPAQSFADRASGLLAISISKMHASYVLWFRPEVVQTVKWGGDPHKPAEQSAHGPVRLHPRKSFETWKETVRGFAMPWQDVEIETVKELRNAVVGIVLRRAEELASLSDELQRSNKELEAFSYSVSHDLRAPFRHVVGYSELLKKQEGNHLSERGHRYIDTIIESAMTAGILVDNLLSFSQMGRASLRPRSLDMNALVEETKQRMALDTKGRRISWTVQDLPAVKADAVMMRLVLENLLSNAVKYTRQRDEAVITVGFRRQPGEIVYFVRDNGVGFDMAYVGKLFGVFQRLHRIEEFEGTGIGLANVRRIIERHGGRTWAEGALDRGATFYFALPDTDAT